ncbi:hypothetical protein [Mesorhizobium sp. M0207]|uniref:hypothetical protein n=1 Tax=unclassified Mesorhizobium TaxID=325217 RepID=UPI00333CB6E5
MLGVEREPGKPAFALMAERGTGRYVGSDFITLNREMRERLWERVQEHSGPAPNDRLMLMDKAAYLDFVVEVIRRSTISRADMSAL